MLGLLLLARRILSFHNCGVEGDLFEDDLAGDEVQVRRLPAEKFGRGVDVSFFAVKRALVLDDHIRSATVAFRIIHYTILALW